MREVTHCTHGIPTPLDRRVSNDEHKLKIDRPDEAYEIRKSNSSIAIAIPGLCILSVFQFLELNNNQAESCACGSRY